MLVGRQQTGVAHGVEGAPGVRLAHGGQAAAVLEAEHLHDELDVDDAAEAALEIAWAAAGLDAAAHGPDLVDDAGMPGAFVDGPVDGVHDLAAEVGVAVDDPGAGQRLVFPELGAAAIVVALELA